MRLKIQEIINACGGRVLNEADLSARVTSISTDTRTIKAGSLFIPLVGENFDAHDYIFQAAENGAICALTERQNTPTDMDIPLIYVSSTRRALMDLADFYRRMHDVKVIAITGSAGKTTTKDMVADILSQKYKTKRTIKNFNNDIGMPLSIFRLEKGDEVLVLEMGMNHANEIHELSLVGEPDIAVITHIGDAHIENFANREGILHAKLEIIDGLRQGGKIIFNGDDLLLTGKIAAEKISNVTHKFFPSSQNIIKAEPIGFQETRCIFNWRGEEVHINVPIPGAHMVMNALLASVVGLEMGVSPLQITNAFANFTPPEGRLNIFETANMTVIDDVYNANPASMLEAIKVLCRKTPENKHRRRVAILGDMNELGHVAEARHFEVGEFAAEEGIDLLIAIGELSRSIYEGFNNENSLYFKSLEDFYPKIFDILQSHDMVLAKASRGMAFELIVKILKSKE
ncbi:MAG: UDP-N-acetylmuramoyl-tripeptide--D-alanyl-D-alanine ligase [Defluviitaleaceae bacterium]|nr:UDP-N-acetylmuramoyl-tripeptide--D-alanyl-D-alanine ligase [Defluviitaleaceae bacterium]